jgi:uncharacterized protein (DUF1778 family)
MGFHPWRENEQSMVVKPGGRFFQEDSLLGYRGRPGRFELLLDDSLAFTVTHDAEGWRKTSLDSTLSDSLPQIWILGCSFTHGYGVNDADNYPAILQQRLPGYRICNYGMDGYGTLQSWLLLRDLLRQGRRPYAVILAYGAFHDQRNTANRYWHKALHGQRIADDIRYPYIRLDKNDSLLIHYGEIDYHPLPLQRYLALASLIEERWNHSEDAGLRSKFVTEILIQRIADASHAAGSHFVLAGIYRHAETTAMLQTFKIEGMQTADISQDLDAPTMRILPGNGHPNAEAHARMADALLDHLQAHFLNQSHDHAP